MAEDAGEQRQNGVDLLHRSLYRRSVCGSGWLDEGTFQSAAQPRQRRAEIVRDVARHLTQLFQQLLDAVEHPVDRAG